MSGITYPSGPQPLAIPTTILLPSAASPFNPSTVNPSVEACWDAIKALENYGCFNSGFAEARPPYTPGTYVNNGAHFFAGGANFTFAGDRAIVFSSPSARPYARPVTAPPQRNPLSWWAALENEISGTDLVPKYKQQYNPLSPSAPWLVWMFHMPGYSTLTGVEIYLKAASAGAHGGNLPATQPILKLWWYSHITGLATAISSGEVQDSQPDAAANALQHKLEVTGLTFGPSGGSLWEPYTSLMIGLRGEEGANAVAAATYADPGLIAHQPRVHFTRARLGEE